MANWYDYPTNFSNGTSVEGVGSLFFRYPNYILNNWFGMGITLLIWLAVFGVSLFAGSKNAILTASFITFIFSVYLFMLGMLNPIVPVILILFTIISAIGAKEERGL